MRAKGASWSETSQKAHQILLCKMHAAIIHMYHTARVDMPEYFRAELSQFVLVIRSIIVQEIHNRGDQYDVGNSPFSFHMYR